MPVFRDHISVEVSKNLKAFVNFEAGVTKGKVPTLRERGARNGKAAQPSLPSNGPVEPAKPPMFFIVGQPKSGTSWLMNLLHAHPEIVCRGEGKLFGRDAKRSLHGALRESARLSDWMERNPWTWREEDSPDLEEIMGVVVEYLMTKKLATVPGRKMVGDKSPFMSTQEVSEIARIMPGSKVVHIVRDGRDVAVSTIHHMWNNAKDEGGVIPLKKERAAKRDAFRKDPSSFGVNGESIFAEGQIEQLAQQWRERVGAAIRDGNDLLGDDYLQLSYEDMLEKPLDNASRIISFLGADARESVVRECVEAVSFTKMADRKPGEEDNKSFYRKGVAGDWKGVFTEEDKRAYKEEAGDFLIELGYERDGGW